MSLITKHPYSNCDVLIGIAHWFNGLVLAQEVLGLNHRPAAKPAVS